MKKQFILLCLIAITILAQAGIVNNVPVTRVQPNGDTIHLLLSGDEYFHRLHDEQGYTILRNPSNGFFTYAIVADGELVASNHIVGQANPVALGIKPNLTISESEWNKRIHAYDVPEQFRIESPKTSGRNHGTLNNLIVFIRFSDDTPHTTTRGQMDAMCNDSTPTATSMFQYFREASYGKIRVVTHFIPAPADANSTFLSYQSIHPRSYYEPYDATTNPIGYQESERNAREFDLLDSCVAWINNNHYVDSSINLDFNNDGLIDNIIFAVKGNVGDWNDLLWPHKFSLYDRQRYINGKRVYTFNLALAGSGTHYFGCSTFCHEMNHSLGAPDLYHYNTNTTVSTVSNWDLMCSNSNPPQHMSAYVKLKYGNWLDSIPEITMPGTYTLSSLADQNLDENPIRAYRIRSDHPNQWYVLEYRDNSEHYETALPGKGLLIYRIDDRFSGNSGYNGTSVFDEIYLYRPGGNNDTTNGNPSQAYFSGSTSRTSFSWHTNPYSWLTGNVVDSTISITNITTPGNTISFTYSDGRGCSAPFDFTSNQVTNTTAALSWGGRASAYRLRYRPVGTSQWSSYRATSTRCTLPGLQPATSYECTITALCGATDSVQCPDTLHFRTLLCATPEADTIGNTANPIAKQYFPISSYYKYSHSQQIYTAQEIGTPMEISAVRFHSSHTETIDTKTDCTIYVGHTTQSTFPNASASIACSTLTKVYEGPMTFAPGWNEFLFTAPFDYNGTDNLVIAIEDNTGAYYNNSGSFFSCSSTAPNYRAAAYYSDSKDPDPNNLAAYTGTKKFEANRNIIQLVGCTPDNTSPLYTISVACDPSMGTVSGGGTYNEGDTVVLSAEAAVGYHFTQWDNGNTDNPYVFLASSDTTFTAQFAINSYTLNANSNNNAYGTVLGSGSYDHGTQVTLSANPVNEHYQFIQWNDGLTDNPRTITLLSDSTFTATFAPFQHTITTLMAAYGESSFVESDCSVEGAGTYDYLSQVTLHAIGTNGNIFVTWNDGNTTNPRSITVISDSTFTALFRHDSQQGIAGVDAGAIVVATNANRVSISGAQGQSMQVLDITGRLIYATKQAKATETLTLPSTGVYLIKTGTTTHKIVVL